MSKYTTELRFICESLNGLTESVGYNDVQSVIEGSVDKIFNFSYPIFDASYKPLLEKKIIKHFYTREIAYETYGRWKLALDTKMNEIMPYYNQLYKSELIEFNPLYDTELTTIGKRTHDDETKENEVGEQKDTGTITNKQLGTINDNGTSKSTDSGSDTGLKTGGDKMNRWDKYSDTPQGTVNYMALNGDGYLTDARNITEDHTGSSVTDKMTYGKINDGVATNLRTYNTQSPQEIDTKRDTETNRKREYDSLVDYSEAVVGKTAGKSYSRMLEEFRRTFLNIDALIIDELESLFMQIW